MKPDKNQQKLIHNIDRLVQLLNERYGGNPFIELEQISNGLNDNNPNTYNSIEKKLSDTAKIIYDHRNYNGDIKKTLDRIFELLKR